MKLAPPRAPRWTALLVLALLACDPQPAAPTPPVVSPGPALAPDGASQPPPTGPSGPTPALVKRAELVNLHHVAGMAAVARYLDSRDQDQLRQAAASFLQAIPASNLPGADRRGRAPEAMLKVQKSLMFYAWVQEQLGDDSVRLWLHDQAIMDPDAYTFFFGSRPLAEVVGWVMILDCLANLEAVQDALERYGFEHQGLYPDSLEALTPTYLPHLPSCPTTGACSYCQGYAPSPDRRGFDLVCDDHQLLQAGPLAIAAGQQGGAAMDPALEQQFKIYTMLTAGYTDTHRVDEQLPHLIRAAGLAPDRVVADIGSGPGLFTHRFAEAVGPKGKVYAVDINASVLAFVDFVAERKQGNVETILAVKTDCGIPEASLDSAMVIQTYHAMLDLRNPADPQRYERLVKPWLESIHRALRPGGRLVVQDTDLPVEVLKSQAQGAGFAFVEQKVLLDKNFILVLERPEG